MTGERETRSTLQSDMHQQSETSASSLSRAMRIRFPPSPVCRLVMDTFVITADNVLVSHNYVGKKKNYQLVTNTKKNRTQMYGTEATTY